MEQIFIKTSVISTKSKCKLINCTKLSRVNRLFVLAFENDAQRNVHSGDYLPNVEIKNHNVIINGEKFFDQPIKDNKVTYENIRKVATSKEMITQLVVC